ncbi:MAG: lytic transglycosylase domain-containing protein [Bacteroidales bacterium]|nr:lytic transglycosylase domain-containing protein [Bacteroidales bacterium]MBN2633083.1 lytic transglycosylase domain-containing protein [Bacteroidales bacterium]
MKYSDRKTIFSILILTGVLLIFFADSTQLKGFGSLRPELNIPDTGYVNRTYKLPEDVTFAGERMPLENFDTRESLEREIITSAYRHSSTILIIKKANRYFPIIEKILRENNIPDDFKYLVAAESEFSNVVSPAGATGFWQIMTATGREQGLEINDIVDERYHIEKATAFACDYLRKSYEKFGSWTLAAASYNGGRAAIDEQIRIQKQTNYYDLLLTEETARYIFRVVAYKLVISDPKAYGFSIEPDELYSPLKYFEVKVDSAVSDFSAFAGHFGTNYKLLKFLNPWLRKPYLRPRQGKVYTIKIPEEGMRNQDPSETEN